MCRHWLMLRSVFYITKVAKLARDLKKKLDFTGFSPPQTNAQSSLQSEQSTPSGTYIPTIGSGVGQ